MSNLHETQAPKSATIVKNYIDRSGKTTIDTLINLLICHIEVYFNKAKEDSESPINTIINLHTLSGSTILMKIVYNLLCSLQEAGLPKAELWELRKQIAQNLHNEAEHILTDKFYKFEDHIK